jgi:protein tyrosine phosphatase (PTP) superfamily phosphohydrolase (DUF442 family)
MAGVAQGTAERTWTWGRQRGSQSPRPRRAIAAARTIEITAQMPAPHVAEQPASAEPKRRPSWWARVLLLIAILLAAGWLAWTSIDAARTNFHQLVRGRAYRCGQLSPSALRSRLAIHRIRSIVNLRGANPQEPWYQEEQAVADELGVLTYDVALCSESAPTSGELRELVRVLATCPRPLLIHCESGLDRTSIAAAIYLLAEENCTVDRAEQQMGIRYGIPPGRGRTQKHRAFVEAYRSWLAEQGRSHTNDHFLYWATHGYRRTEPLGGPDWPIFRNRS